MSDLSDALTQYLAMRRALGFVDRLVARLLRNFVTFVDHAGSPFITTELEEKGDAAALGALEAIGKPDPKNVKQYFGFSRPIRQYMNASDTAWLANLMKLLEASGETEASIKAIGDGMNASAAALVEDMISEDLSSNARTFKGRVPNSSKKYNVLKLDHSADPSDSARSDKVVLGF